MKRAFSIVGVVFVAALSFACVALGIAGLRAASAFKEVQHAALDQRRLLDVDTAARARLMTDLRVALTCDRVGVMGKGRDAITCREIGSLPALSRAATNMADAAAATATMARNTDQSINGKDGVVAKLEQQIAVSGKDLGEVTAQVKTLVTTVSDGTRPLLTDADTAVRGISAQANNPDVSRAVKATADSAEHVSVATDNMAAATGDVKDQVHRWTHPKALTTAANWFLKVVHAVGGWF